MSQIQKLSDDTTQHKCWILHDRSGSMSGWRQGVIDGTNEILDGQRQRDVPGTCRVTIAQFDSEEPLRIAVDARRVERVRSTRWDDFEPRGLTPLYDAIAALIARVDQRIADRERRRRPAEEQLVVIMTDGLENASVDFTQAQVFDLITQRRDQGWTFVFMGANQDSYAVGGSLGVAQGNIKNWEASDEGAREAQRSVSRAYAGRRRMSAASRAASRDQFFVGADEAEESRRGERV